MGPRGVELTSELKSQIIQHYKHNKSIRTIASLVQKCPATVQKVIERYRVSGSIKNKLRPGRPRKFDETEQRLILQKVQENTKMSALKLQAEVERETGKLCNTETIRRVLYSAGYIGPLIHRKRVEFAKSYIERDHNYWRTVIFSSICHFHAYQNAQKVTLWRRITADTPNSDTSTSDTSVMHSKQAENLITLWGCMAAGGVGQLFISDTKMNPEKYFNILQAHVLASATKLQLPAGGFTFQQAHDCKYSTGAVRAWLLYKVGKVLCTPSQSSDLNPMEEIWSHLDCMVQKRAVESEMELRALLECEWQQLAGNVTETLVASMPKRLQAILDTDLPKVKRIRKREKFEKEMEKIV